MNISNITINSEQQFYMSLVSIICQGLLGLFLLFLKYLEHTKLKKITESQNQILDSVSRSQELTSRLIQESLPPTPNEPLDEPTHRDIPIGDNTILRFRNNRFNKI